MSSVFIGINIMMFTINAHAASVEISVYPKYNLTRVVLDLDKSLEITSFTLTNPHRIVVIFLKAAKVKQKLIAPDI